MPTSAPAPAQPDLTAPRGSAKRGWWRLQGATIAVALAAFGITALLMWGASSANDRSGASLLQLQARETASALSAALPAVQSQLSDALTVASATGSASTFERFAATKIASSRVVSESLWKSTVTGFQLMARVGSPPQLVTNGDAARFFAGLRPTPTLQLTGIMAGSPPRLGYAEFPSSSSHYAVYAESLLPASRHFQIPASSPFRQLDYALYLGRGTRPDQLIESSVRTPVTGSHATVEVPLGDTVITLVATPRAPLTSAISQALPWIALGGGLALSFAGAVVVEYLGRRRRLADELNARLADLYASQRSIAETLQRSLLPERLPEVPGMELAARYLPGVQDVDVGGDWYDVVVLDQDRFVFVVGDVSGRGVRAAAVMASVRFASRGFALEGHSPAGILTQLAKTLDVSSDGHFATVLCGLIDVGRREVTLANAGHFPPLVRSDSSVRTLHVPPAPPVGVAHPLTVAEHTVDLPAGATVLAYTDGLVERRGENITVSIERLEKVAAQQASSLDDLLTKIVTDMTMDAPHDDVAVIGFKWTS